jgi:hypothetical protein
MPEGDNFSSVEEEGDMGGRTWARFAIVLALVVAAGGAVTAQMASAVPTPPPSPGQSLCPTVARDAHATWVMPDGVTSAGVYVREGTTVAVSDPYGMCVTAPVWINVSWHTTLTSCDSYPTAVPAGAFTMDPTLSTASLDASTSCGDVHVTWTSPSPPSLQPGVADCTFTPSCVYAGVWVERASHAEGTVGPVTGTQDSEWPQNPPSLGVLVST